MANPVATGRPVSERLPQALKTPTRQAYEALHLAFVLAPLIAGFDKFTRFLANWDSYLAPQITSFLNIGARDFMRVVGVIEIAAGLIVAIKPKIGGYIVAIWLVAIIANLLLGRHYYDVALRDLGLALGALALARLASAQETAEHT